MALNAVVAAGALMLALTLPQPLLLPALSILFVVVGFGAASGLFLSGYRLQSDHPGWETSGLLVFLGFAAAILADLPEALTALGAADDKLGDGFRQLTQHRSTLQAAIPRRPDGHDVFGAHSPRPGRHHRRRSGRRQCHRVGLAASRVAPELRAKVIFWGIVGAVVLRITFAAVTVQLLAIVGLTLAGGILLLWVCWKMYREIRHVPRPAGVGAQAVGGERTMARSAFGARSPRS